MRLLIAVLGTICILPSAAFALECIQCFARNSEFCDGPSVLCEDAKECMVLSEYYHIDQNIYHTVKKDCNELYPCGKTLYGTDQFDIGLRAHIQCCEGNNCNTFNYKMPPENIEFKGDYCSSCFGHGLKECESKRMIKCEEINDQCFEYIGKIRDPVGKELDVNTKGCFSREGCTAGFKSMIGATEIVSVSFICSDPVKNI